jgi:hypothetical protein
MIRPQIQETCTLGRFNFARGTSEMTSGSDCEHPADSDSGPSTDAHVTVKHLTPKSKGWGNTERER